MSSAWFVECRVNEKFDGWFSAPPEGIGGWLTEDPNQAKKYTEAEAMAVASALSYFRCPFRHSRWIATEHIFMAADSPVSDGREGLPLRATVENDQLSIVIGVRTLAFAFENSDENNPYDENFCDTKRQFSISDPPQFAKDVCHELNSEGEDGSTPLTRFLDSMMGEAVNQGSLGILDPDETADSTVS